MQRTTVTPRTRPRDPTIALPSAHVAHSVRVCGARSRETTWAPVGPSAVLVRVVLGEPETRSAPIPGLMSCLGTGWPV